MKQKIKVFLQKEKFDPSWLGVFVNPYYFIRRGLFLGIRDNTKYLNGKMLDFGCGSKPYKKLVEVEEYIGVDIEESGNHHRDAEIDVYYDGKTIPFDDGHFDSVFSSEVLEHVFEPDLILSEINRVCKKGGHLLLTVPFVWNEHEQPYDYGRYSSFGIKHLISKHGFEIVHHSKTTNFIQTVFQLWNTYVFQNILRKPAIQMIFTPFIIAPVTIAGAILSKILPTSNTFYFNNIVVAKKVNDTL